MYGNVVHNNFNNITRQLQSPSKNLGWTRKLAFYCGAMFKKMRFMRKFILLCLFIYMSTFAGTAASAQCTTKLPDASVYTGN